MDTSMSIVRKVNEFRCGIPSSEPYRIRKCNFIQQLRTPTEMSPSILVSRHIKLQGENKTGTYADAKRMQVLRKFP